MFVKLKNNNQADHVMQPKKTDCSRLEIYSAHQDVRIQYKKISAAINTHQMQDKNLQINQSAYVIQMFNPNAPDTWKRPEFYLGIKEKLWVKQIGLYHKDIDYQDPITEENETTIMTLCPVCRGPLDYMGATIDHITNWRDYAYKIWRVKTEGELKEAYNDTDNLILVHSGCNSSKGESQISEFGALGHVPHRRSTWGTIPELQEMGRRVKETSEKIIDYYDDMESRRNVQELKQLYTIYRITGDSRELNQKLNNF